MATNPMQRRSRNSFMLGMLLMFVISAVIIGFLAIQLLNKTKQESVEKKTMRNVCVLNTDVKSGQEITSDMIKKIQVRHPTKRFGSGLLPVLFRCRPPFYRSA